MTPQSGLEPGVAEEAEEQAALRTDPVGSLSSSDRHHLQVSLASVGEFLALQVRPEALGRFSSGW